MTVTAVNASFVVPKSGAEVDCATLPGGPFDLIDVFVQGDDGNQSVTFRLYAVVGSLTSVVAESTYVGNVPQVLTWIVNGQIDAVRPVHVGGGSYILRALVAQADPQGNPISFRCTIAGVASGDVAGPTEASASVVLPVSGFQSVVTAAGYSERADIGINLNALTDAIEVVLYANCGAGSVEAPIYSSFVQAGESPIPIGSIPQIPLAIATTYRLAVRKQTPGGIAGTCTASLSTYSATATGGSSSNVVLVSNVVALRALSTAIPHIQLLGYYVSNDGGGGFFDYDAGSNLPDDGGVVIQPTAVVGAGRWLRNYGRGPLNALWFGLKNDGVTPNDAANSRMIASTAAQLGEGIFYPGGNYIFAATIGPYPIGGITSGAGVSGRSTGLSSSIGTTFLFTGQGVGLQAGGHAPAANVGNGATFENFEILGQNPNGNASFPNINEIGIEIQTDTNVKLNNIRFGGFKYQLSFDGCETCVADGMYFDGLPPGGLGYPAAEMITDFGVNSAFAVRFGAFNSSVGASACNGNILTNIQLNNTFWGIFHQGGIGSSLSNVNTEIKGVAIFGGTLGSAATFATSYFNVIGEGANGTNFLILTSTYDVNFYSCRLGQDAHFLDIQAPVVGLDMNDCYFINTTVDFPVVGSVNVQGGNCAGCQPPQGAGASTADVIFDAEPLMLVDSGSGLARQQLGINCQPKSPLDVNDNRIRIRVTLTPANSADPVGNVGDVAWDAGFIYVKTAAGWKRSALGAF